jgi:transcriptional regulator with XRE-family HTH domain
MTRSKTEWRTPDLGAKLAEIRQSRKLTLKNLAELTGIPASTLSKVQNQQRTLSFENLVKLARGLRMELSDMFSEQAVDIKTGRRSITRRGDGAKEATDHFAFELLCNDLRNKRMNPAIMEISATTLKQAGGLNRHAGEEFIYVISGSIELHSEDYASVTLQEGDSVYIDSTSGHAYVNAGKKPACILAVTTHLLEDASHLDIHTS